MGKQLCHNLGFCWSLTFSEKPTDCHWWRWNNVCIHMCGESRNDTRSCNQTHNIKATCHHSQAVTPPKQISSGLFFFGVVFEWNGQMSAGGCWLVELSSKARRQESWLLSSSKTWKTFVRFITQGYSLKDFCYAEPPQHEVYSDQCWDWMLQ